MGEKPKFCPICTFLKTKKPDDTKKKGTATLQKQLTSREFARVLSDSRGAVCMQTISTAQRSLKTSIP